MRRWIGIVGGALVAWLALTLWLTGSGGREGAPSPALVRASVETEEARERHEDVVPASVPGAEAGEVARASERESLAGPAVPHGRLRGQLVRAEDGRPFQAERTVVLAALRDSVAETVRSDADGRFTTEREFPRGTVRAFVRDPVSGATLARHEARFDPEAAGAWLVPVAERERRADRPVAHEEGDTWLHGRVVDLAARPVADAMVKGIPLDGRGEMAAVPTADSGEFELTGLEPGRHRLLVQGRFASAAPLELVLLEGPNEAGTMVLPARPVAGAIEGRLVAEDGDQDLFGALLLRDLESGKERVETTDFGLFEPHAVEEGQAFVFRDVPAGRYELSLVALDGRLYEPEQMLVEPPASELEFRAQGPNTKGFRLRAYARESGEALGFFYAVRLHGQWFGDDTAAGKDEEMPWPVPWIVWAEGRRPVRGGPPEPRGDETEPLSIDVALERGHGEVLLFKDVASDRLLAHDFGAEVAPGLPGVSVWSEGLSIGTSDADGLLLVDLPSDPGELEFRHPGWRVLAEDRLEGGIRLVQLVRE